MSLITVKITDSVISAHADWLSVTRLRDSTNPAIQFRFSRNRSKGYWFVYAKSWHKVGDWPTSKTRDVRQGFGTLINKISLKQTAKIAPDCFSNVADLLTWYQARKAGDAYLSVQRKKDIKSAVHCHLITRLGNADFDNLTHAYLDNNFIQPLQKYLAKSTVSKLFRTLKTAFYDASHLHMIDSNPLIGIKITDFGDFISRPKGSALKPYMTQALLDGLKDQKPVTQMIVLVMITLGTRIGETRQAKWKNLYFGEQAVWTIPASDTKTAEDHTISLPPEVAGLFRQWKKYQTEGQYSGPYLFPCLSGKAPIGSSEASALIKEFSAGEWSSHDLRKCARIAWAEQGTDFAVGEKMLSHKLGAIAEAYLDTKVTDLRLQALKTHVTWLLSLKKTCFLLV